MKRNEIEKEVEKYLKKTYTASQLLNSIQKINCLNSRQRFKCNTIKRLVLIMEKWRQSEKYYFDFLIALREYLLAFNNPRLSQDIFKLPNADKFGIIIQDGQLRCYLDHIPEGITEKFVRDIYDNKNNRNRSRNTREILETDGKIYTLTGYKEFKSMRQKIAVYGALKTPRGYTTLISLPTGGGKSLITQSIAYQDRGMTIVVVPTVSLAIDQEKSAKKVIKSDSVDEEIFYYASGISKEELQKIITSIQMQKAKLLFISPEALQNNDMFKEIIKTANDLKYLTNIVIDEAHIVIDWGRNFRPDFQALESWRRNMMHDHKEIRTFLLSATFVEHDIEILKNLFSDKKHWIEIRCDALRKEPRFNLIKVATFDQKRDHIIELVKMLPHPMIVYTDQPSQAEEYKSLLENHGIYNIRTFTGNTSNDKRKKIIDEWKNDEFEIMIATSAFGVGVDKSDVRTVLHTYVPQNPNSYYQELGRGGRDGLPCLSVMCIVPQNDVSSAKTKMMRGILSEEKVFERWKSMFNNPKSKRIDRKVIIDTSIVPNYNESNDQSSYTNEGHVRWNIYVLFLLRRCNLITINNVAKEDKKYIFTIEINDDVLYGENQVKMINKIHDVYQNEAIYYNDSFDQLKQHILYSGEECWSEMFYDTYGLVDEYCAGCDEHENIIDDTSNHFLKKAVIGPTLLYNANRFKWLNENREAAIIAPKQDYSKIVAEFANHTFITVVVPNDYSNEEIEKLICEQTRNNVFILRFEDIYDLIKNKSFYFVCGLIVVVYDSQKEDQAMYFSFMMNNLSMLESIKIIHLMNEDLKIKNEKRMSDFIDGALINEQSLGDEIYV